MKAEHRKELETNALAESANSLVDRIKSGRVGNYWVIAVVAAILVVGGVWWYAAREGRKADSSTWAAFVGVMRGPTHTDIDDFVKNNDKTTAAQLARLEQARMHLGSDGLMLLRSDESAQRAKGAENLEQARTELLKLADEFKKNPSLRASTLVSAAEAELALVGVPKKDNPGSEKRGSVKVAAELYRDAAKTIGEATPAGEGLIKRADEIEKKASDIAQVSDALYKPISTPGFGGAAPSDPKADGPKVPDKIDPKGGGDPKIDGPKAPDKSLTPIPPPTPPTTTPPTAKTPAPVPPTTPPTAKTPAPASPPMTPATKK